MIAFVSNAMLYLEDLIGMNDLLQSFDRVRFLVPQEVFKNWSNVGVRVHCNVD